jgi:hypothetical protein
MWAEVAELIGLVLFTSVKFLFAPLTIYALGYTFWQTIIISVFGGWLGVIVFYYSGSLIFNWLGKFQRKKSPKKFTKRNRFVIWLKNGFGLNGIAFVLGFGSIPIVCLLAAKYFRSDKRTIYYMMASVIAWSFVLTGVSVWLKPYLLRFI